MFALKSEKVMWPSGKARVCKTLYDGSIPSVTSQEALVLWQAIVRGGVFPYPPFFFVL
jgi:hypothetical protein